MISKDIYIIVRSLNERTEKVCCELIRRNYPSNKFEVINKTPFYEALKAGYEICLKKNHPWSLFIDADVLIRKDALNILLKYGENSNKEISEVHGLILDKFFNVAKPAGVRLYRTKYLEKALKILLGKKSELRPEYSTLLEMKNEGLPWLGIGYIVGLHDFEQFYRDIFRKFFLHSFKHYDKIIEILPFLRSNSKYDNDFKAALWGLAAGLISNTNISNDYKSVPFEIYDLLKGPEWYEKDIFYFTPEIEQMIENKIRSYVFNNPVSNLDDRVLVQENFMSSDDYRNFDFNLKLQYLLGDLLQKVGKKLKKRSLVKNFGK